MGNWQWATGVLLQCNSLCGYMAAIRVGLEVSIKRLELRRFGWRGYQVAITRCKFVLNITGK
jgi:hypothetical protein